MNTPAQPSYAKYLGIWAALIVLLVAGTYSSSLPLSKGRIILVIGLISFIKAALVGLFYMHLKFERAIPLWAVAVSPFFLIGLAVLLVFLGTSLS